MICPVMEEDRAAKKLSFKVDDKVSCLKCFDSRMYIGLMSGALLVYSRDKGRFSLNYVLLLAKDFFK